MTDPEPESHHISNGTAPCVQQAASSTNASLAHALSQTEPDAPRRATWGGRLEFLLSCVGYAVGLGNVWRFPYLCYANGGGAFLIPYILMMILAGMPLLFLELSLGQYASLGTISVWRSVPLFKGIGYSMVVLSTVVSIYYNIIIGYTVYYFFASFTSKLPWSGCSNSWNTCNCTTHAEFAQLTKNDSLQNVTSTLTPVMTSSASVVTNSSDPCAGVYVPIDDRVTPAEEYWLHVLGLTDGLHHLGQVRWHLVLCLLLAWIVVYLCIIKGIKSSGKVVYFTATFPYVVLVILFFRGVTLPGAGDGILFYLRPDFHKMAHAQVWKDAAVQILYSLGPGFGGLLTLASFNKFDNNCHRDAILVTFINCGTSVFAGFVIFSVLGYMSHMTGLDVHKVVHTGGPGLAFIAYPEGISMMSGAPFWSIIFFFMLFTLGLDSQFAGMECIVAALTDEYKLLRDHKNVFTLVLCAALFCLGIPCVTEGGMYLVQLMDKYATAFPLIITTCLEAVVLTWIYGYRRWWLDLEIMLGFKPSVYWIICWMVATPVILIAILIFSAVEYDGMKYRGYKYPQWAEDIGWLMMISSIIMIPLWACIQFGQKVGSWQNLRWLVRGPTTMKSLNMFQLILPADDWGPALPENKQQRHEASLANPEADRPRFKLKDAEFESFVNQQTSYGLTENGDSYI